MKPETVLNNGLTIPYYYKPKLWYWYLSSPLALSPSCVTCPTSQLALLFLGLHFFHPFPPHDVLICSSTKTWHWQCLSLQLPVHIAFQLVEYTSPSTMRSCRGWLHWTPPCPHKAPKSHGHHYSRNSCMSGMTQ